MSQPTDDVWTAPVTDEAPAEPTDPAPLVATPGAPIDPVQLLQRHFEDVKDHIGDYLVAGLGFMAVLLGCTLVTVAPVFLAVFAGGASGDETVMMGLLGGAMLWYALGLLGLVVLVVPAFTGSFLRAIDRHQRLGLPLGFGAAFRDPGTRLGPTIGIHLVTQLIAFVGALFCYLPALLSLPFTAFAVPLVAVRGMGVADAVRATWGHMKEHPQFHVVFHLLAFGTSMLLYLIPFVGLVLILPWLYGLNMVAFQVVFPAEADG